jgi:hypothetical protein
MYPKRPISNDDKLSGTQPSRDSLVGIATPYGVDGQGIESPWGQDFLHQSRSALGPTQPPIQGVPGHSQG